jgi:hypothetical protein
MSKWAWAWWHVYNLARLMLPKLGRLGLFSLGVVEDGATTYACIKLIWLESSAASRLLIFAFGQVLLNMVFCRDSYGNC